MSEIAMATKPVHGSSEVPNFLCNSVIGDFHGLPERKTFSISNSESSRDLRRQANDERLHAS